MIALSRRLGMGIDNLSVYLFPDEKTALLSVGIEIGIANVLGATKLTEAFRNA